ncbi:MAG: tyrosine-protein phosphatase [Propioniciclava sp.]
MTTLLDLTPSAPVNLRDIAGVAVGSAAVAPGLAWRSDDLSVIDTATADALVAAGLVAVIDLRTATEVALTGRGPLADTPVSYHHLPLMTSVAEGIRPGGAGMDNHTMGLFYAQVVEQAAPQLATALTVIALAPGRTAFHCTAGRDRTGVLAALLLLSLGASPAAVVAEYSLSQPNMAAVEQRMAPVMGPLMTQLGFDLAAMPAMIDTGTPMASTMETMLATLTERQGDPLAPVRAAGLAAETEQRLRVRAGVG